MPKMKPPLLTVQSFLPMDLKDQRRYDDYSGVSIRG